MLFESQKKITHAEPPFIYPDWPCAEHVHALISSRDGGVSLSPFDTLNVGMHVGDNPAHVAENRAIIQQKVTLPIAYLNQVHGVEVVRASDALAGQKNDQPIEADAVVASQDDAAVCAVMTADCLPVLFCDRAGTVVAAAHAGWRGLAAGVLQKTVEMMRVPPREILAYLGPAIGPNAFEVGQDVWDAFCHHNSQSQKAFFPHGQSRYLADIYILARQRLNSVGVHDISGGNFCTFSDEAQFFSYRRSSKTGRMLSCVWLDL